MEIPYLIGFELDKALDEIKTKYFSYDFAIVETMPLNDNLKKKTSECRVVRQRVSNNIIEITISYF